MRTYSKSEFLEELKNELIKRDMLTSQGIEYILKKVSLNPAGSMLLCNPILKNEPFLTLEEKKKAGINTRIKISKTFFESLSPRGISLSNPNEELIHALYQTDFKLHNRYQLQEYRRLGCTKVEILPCGDQRDCKASLLVKGKFFHIDEVPELPLPDCNADHCRCWYRAEISWDDEIDKKKQSPAKTNNKGCAVLLIGLIILAMIIYYSF